VIQQRFWSRRAFLQMSAMMAGASALAACATAGAPTTAPTEGEQEASGRSQSAAPQQVRYASFDWFAMVPGQLWDEYNQQEAFEQYKQEHGEVEILWEPHGDGWETKVLTNMAAGTAPDIMATWPPVINTWAEKQQLLDLQPLVDVDIPNANDIFLKTGWDQAWDPITQIRMAMVTDIDVTSVYYNKLAFEEAGVPLPTPDWTTDQYTDAATKLTQRDGNGNITRWGAQLRPDATLGYFYYVQAFGGDVRDDETQMICLLDQEPAQQALEWIRQGMWDLNCFGQNNQINATGIPNTWTGVLPANIVAFAERSADQFFALADTLPEGSWNIAHVARGPVDQACMGAPDLWCVFKGVTERGNQDAVWQFLRWMATSDYYQENIAAKAGRIPGLTSAAEKWPTILRGIDGRLEPVELEVVLDQLQTGEARGPQLFRFQSVADELINPAMEQIFVEGKAPVSILADVAAQVTEAQAEALERAGG
jgi:ABC-type glycerol-3-phosphate transport system substrate-binding protein